MSLVSRHPRKALDKKSTPLPSSQRQMKTDYSDSDFGSKIWRLDHNRTTKNNKEDGNDGCSPFTDASLAGDLLQ